MKRNQAKSASNLDRSPKKRGRKKGSKTVKFRKEDDFPDLGDRVMNDEEKFIASQKHAKAQNSGKDHTNSQEISSLDTQK